MLIKIHGNLNTKTTESSIKNTSRNIISFSGEGPQGNFTIEGDGQKSILDLIKTCGILEALSTLTITEPTKEEEGLTFIPKAGSSVQVYMAIQANCFEEEVTEEVVPE